MLLGSLFNQIQTNLFDIIEQILYSIFIAK